MIGLEYSSLISNGRMNEWQTCFCQLDRRMVFAFCFSLGYTPNRVLIAIMEIFELGLRRHLMHTMCGTSKDRVRMVILYRPPAGCKHGETATSDSRWRMGESGVSASKQTAETTTNRAAVVIAQPQGSGGEPEFIERFGVEGSQKFLLGG